MDRTIDPVRASPQGTAFVAGFDVHATRAKWWQSFHVTLRDEGAEISRNMFPGLNGPSATETVSLTIDELRSLYTAIGSALYLHDAAKAAVPA